MSGLLGGIVSNTQALSTHSMGLQVAGKNLANVNNDAYSRQRLVNLTQPATGQNTLQVEQIRDAVLDANVVLQNSETSNLEAQASVYQSLQTVLNETLGDDLSSSLDGATSSSETGLHGAFTSFFNAWDALAADPSDSAARELVVQQGEYIASMFNNAASDLETVDDGVLDYMQDNADQANALIENIAQLNEEIVKLENNSTAQAVDLRDSRQLSIEALANLMNVKTVEEDDGSVTLSIPGADAGNDVVLVQAGQVLQSIEVNENIDNTDPLNPIVSYDIQANDGANLVDLSLTGGTLYGYQQMHDSAISDLTDRLDTLAGEFVSQINAAYADTDGDGMPDDTSGDGAINSFFNVANVTASDISMSLSDGGELVLGVADANGDINAGDNTYALRVADLANEGQAGLSDLSFSDYSLDIVTDLATDASKNAAFLENEQLASDLIEDQRASISGVSMDEEVTNLLRYQRSFQASAKVVNTMDQLLDLVVNRLVS